MKGGILKLLHLLSNQSNPTIPTRIAIPPAITLRRYLSSLPIRPARGGRRRDTRDEDDRDSEEFFLRSLNFGSDNPDHRLHSDPNTTSRPLRGEPRRAFDHGEDLFSENGNRKTTIGRADPFVGIPDRPMRGDRRERRPPEESFDFGSFGAPREEEGAKRRDLGDQGITFDKEEWDQEITFDKRAGDAQSGPSLSQKLKFTDSKEDRKEEEKRVIEDLRERSSKEERGMPEDADAIFSRLKKTGLIPNAVAMLDGLCKDGLIQEAMKLFGLMREKGTIPEVVIYTAVVEGFCKAGKCEDAKRIFRKMQKNGIAPNAFSYGILIQGLCKGKRWNDCVEFALEMVVSGHSPNVVTFTGLVDGICKDKGVEEADKVIRRLREGGVAVDEKAVRDHLDKKGPFSPLVWEAIFGKKGFKNIF